MRSPLHGPIFGALITLLIVGSLEGISLYTIAGLTGCVIMGLLTVGVRFERVFTKLPVLMFLLVPFLGQAQTTTALNEVFYKKMLILTTMISFFIMVTGLFLGGILKDILDILKKKYPIIVLLCLPMLGFSQQQWVRTTESRYYKSSTTVSNVDMYSDPETGEVYIGWDDVKTAPFTIGNPRCRSWGFVPERADEDTEGVLFWACDISRVRSARYKTYTLYVVYDGSGDPLQYALTATDQSGTLSVDYFVRQ